MLLRHARRGTAGACLLIAALLLMGCDSAGHGAEPEASPPAHPVFSEPLDAQPAAALKATRAAGSADFTQVLTFTSKQGDAVLTTKGQFHHARGWAHVTRTWTLDEGFSDGAGELLLGTAWSRGAAGRGERIEVEPGSVVHYRATGSPYWLRYTGEFLSKAEAGGDVDHVLRDSAGPVGRLLVESIPPHGPTTMKPASDGGRVYRIEGPLYRAQQDLFSDEIGAEIGSRATEENFPLAVSVDAEGRITRIQTDFAALGPGGSGGLGAVTGVRSVLTFSRYGGDRPAPRPATDTVLAASSHVQLLTATKPGDCIDERTGLDSSAYVVRVACGEVHDGRVYARVALTDGPYPGAKEAERQATGACRASRSRAPSSWTEADEPGTYWSSWPGVRGWADASPPKVTCYVRSR